MKKTIKLILKIALCFIAICSFANKSYAAEGTWTDITATGCSNCQYKEDTDGGINVTLYFRATGENAKITKAAIGNFSNMKKIVFVNNENGKLMIDTCKELFLGCSELTSIDLSGLDTSYVEDMSSMFEGCTGLTSIELTGMQTSFATNMSSMFKDCSCLTSLDVSGFNTQRVGDMPKMFMGCHDLMELDLSKFNTDIVNDMSYMFKDCTNLQTLDLLNFSTSVVKDMSGMFQGCESILTLDITSFDTLFVTKMAEMFKDCGLSSIYVSDKWNTDKVTSSENMFTNSSNLKGEKNTNYDSNKTDKTYAHIDGGTSNPGYLSSKNIVIFHVLRTTCSQPDSQIIPVGGKATEPEAPECPGYVFGGWYTSEEYKEQEEWNFNTDVVSGRVDLYANWIRQYVYFGAYPQTEITDTATIEKIETALAKFGKTSGDVWADGIKYRKYDDSYFRWEKIKWKILSLDEENGKMLLQAEDVLDNMGWAMYIEPHWKNAKVRNWLNGEGSYNQRGSGFYNTAFSLQEREGILTTSVLSDGSQKTPWEDQSNDKVFILSLSELTNIDYGYCDNIIKARYDFHFSDYSECMYCSTNPSESLYLYLMTRTYASENMCPTDFDSDPGTVSGLRGKNNCGPVYINKEKGYSKEAVLRFFGADMSADELKPGINPVINLSIDSTFYNSQPDTSRISGLGGGDEPFDIIYELNGGTNPIDAPFCYLYDDGFALDDYPVPTKEHYVFDGWYKDNEFNEAATAIPAFTTETVTVYAKWVPEGNQKIDYVLNGGTNPADALQYYVYEQGFALEDYPVPTKEHYVFDGWYKDNEFNEAATAIPAFTTETVTVYAKWVPEEYRITYELNGGENSAQNPTKYIYGVGVSSFAAPALSGYDFGGWFSDSKLTKKVTSIDKKAYGNVTLYAKWNKEFSISEDEFFKNSMILAKGFSCKTTKGKAKVTWGKIKSAAGYQLKISYCSTPLDTIEKDVQGAKKTSVTVSKIKNAKIDETKAFKVVVSAYAMVKGEKVTIGEAPVFHIAGRKCKNTNPSKLTVSKKPITVKKGRTKVLTTKITKAKADKRLLNARHGSPVRFYSSNTSIATVDLTKGTVKGIRKGSCKIYVITINGIVKEVKINVTGSP